MRTLFALFAGLTLAACGARDDAVQANDATRITNQIAQQANEIRAQAENGTVAIEQALENEGAALFESRNALLGAPANASSAAGNRQR